MLLALLPAAARAADSSAPSPVVTFSTPGVKTVTLQVCNSDGCSTLNRTVEVLDPKPSITSASLGASSAEVGQWVSMNGAATGRPQLAYSWAVKLGTTTLVTLTGSSASLDTSMLAPGNYTATLTVSNGDGSASSSALPLSVQSPPAQAFYTLTPCRLLDTRGGAPLTAGGWRVIAVAGACNIPAGARAVAVNVTVVGPTGGGHMALVPGDAVSFSTSTLNFATGQTRANFSVLRLSGDGSGTLAAYAGLVAGSSLDLVLDVTGYFLPVP